MDALQVRKILVMVYYIPIHQSITLNETVDELLKRSEEATQEVGRIYTINTFDLVVCMKALPLVWKYPDTYLKHIIMPGPFHTEMNYIGMLTNHKARGSGYAEILLEAGLAEKGCLKHVLSGKAFATAMFNLKATVDALERLLLDEFVEQTNAEIRPQALLNVNQTCNRQSVDAALHDESTNGLMQMWISRNRFAWGISERLLDFGSRSWMMQNWCLC